VIISRTPYRISFFGGGTDYPAWFRRHGGSVLATTIDKYCYLTCRYLPPFFEHRFRIVYSRIENCASVEEIAHPAVREVIRHLRMDRGLEIHHDGDLPARSGMGSSSAFTVGLLHALYALKGVMPGKRKLARESIHIEQDVLRETVGSQDQAATAYGGLNHMTFLPDGEISVQPVALPAERILELNAHLMLFYTGIRRTASDVAGSYARETAANERELATIGELVGRSLSVLEDGGPIGRFGTLMHEAWEAKRRLGPEVSNPVVDRMYSDAVAAGALGGKLTGAGGGGFLLLFVPPERRQAVREALGGLIHVPFQFEHAGSQIIFFEPEEDFSGAENDHRHRKFGDFRELADIRGERRDPGERP
jgi:D-glycero-alpha-D-manno-heptose-7-phosphate kinase